MDRNTVLTRRQAQDAIDALGYAHPPQLVARCRRGNGPEHAVSKGGRYTYRWGDVLDWLEKGFRNQVKCDLSGTRLGRWILEHKLTVPTFAARVKLSPRPVYKLVGHKNDVRGAYRASECGVATSVLELVSMETDIAVGDLVEDMIGIRREDAA